MKEVAFCWNCGAYIGKPYTVSKCENCGDSTLGNTITGQFCDDDADRLATLSGVDVVEVQATLEPTR